MKTTGFRSFVLYILLFAFLGGLVYFLASLVLNGADWVAQPYNGHIYAEDATLSAGTITDRDGMILASTEDGARTYAESESVRRSLLHTVGDSSGYIGTSVQATHRSQLIGWNLFTGLNDTIFSGLGTDIRLTIDADANAAAFDAFGGHDGAAFIYNYETGEESYAIGDSQVTCLDYHGELTLEQALGHSCNIYFAKLALDIGAEALQEKAEEMGFGESFQFDSITTYVSQIDLSDASDLELAWSSVGQAEVMANPYHMALLMGAIANGGTTPEPYLMGGGTRTEYTLTDSTTAAALHEMMRNNVVNYYGDSMFGGYTVCAKTGTAELDDQNPNCWIVGFSDDPDAPYALAVCVQEGDSGLYTAGQVIAAALNALT